MTVKRLVLVRGRQNSGKSTVLKAVANQILSREDATRLLLCKGACQRMTTEQISFERGDVTVVIDINGHVVVVVTMGDVSDVAARVDRLLDNLPILANRHVDLLITAVRDTRNHALETHYRGLFGDPIVLDKRRVQGESPVDPNNLNADAVQYLNALIRFQMMLMDVTNTIQDVVKEAMGEK